jgi:DNA polymerase-4
MRRYRAVSQELCTILESYSPVLEQVSIDEAFLDITGCTHLYGGSRQTGRALQARIKKETGLSCSVGIAPSKLVAKIASDLRKPGGLVVVKPGEEESFLAELPIDKLLGVGKTMEGKLQEMGISTVRQFRGLSRSYLRRRFGKRGEQLYEYARGIDNRVVARERVRKSISSEVTFAENIRQGELLQKSLQKLCADVAQRLWRENVWANALEVKVRFADFVTVARSCSLPCPTRRFRDLTEQARMLLNTRFNLEDRSIRLLGVSVSKLDHNQQLHFFSSDSDDSLSQALADLRAKFGPDSVRRGL